MKKIYLLAGLTLLSMILALAAGLVFATGWAELALRERAQAQFGRDLTVAGGSSVEFAPRLALRFDTVDIANADGLDGSVLSAEALRVPMTLSGLLRRSLGQEMMLVNPRLSLEISGKGDVSWAAAAKGPTTPAGMHVTVTGGTIAFYDHRNEQHFELRDAELVLDTTADGAVTLNGSAVLGGRSVTLDAYVKSLPRVDGEGSPVELSLASDVLSATVSGRLSTATALALAGTAALSGPSLRQAAQWLGVALPGDRGFGAFAMSGELEGDGYDLTLRNADLTLDGLSAKGSLGLALGGERPQLLADLGLDRLDLTHYLAAPAAGAAGWSEAPLDYAALRHLDARVAFNANGLRYGPFAAGKATVQASLAAGRLGAVITSDEVMGGTARIDIEADGSGASPVLSLHVEGQKLDGAELSAAAAGAGLVSGPATLSLNVSGYGPSAAAIVSTLKGSARLGLQAGSLTGLDVKGLLGAVTQRIVDGWQRAADQSTAVTALSAGFDIADGIATTRDLSLEAPDLAIDGSGSVDLLRQSVDLALAPRLAGAAFPVPVAVKGPWGAPRIYPDVPDLLLKPEEGFARLKAMGLPPAGGN